MFPVLHPNCKIKHTSHTLVPGGSCSSSRHFPSPSEVSPHPSAFLTPSSSYSYPLIFISSSKLAQHQLWYFSQDISKAPWAPVYLTNTTGSQHCCGTSHRGSSVGIDCLRVAVRDHLSWCLSGFECHPGFLSASFPPSLRMLGLDSATWALGSIQSPFIAVWFQRSHLTTSSFHCVINKLKKTVLAVSLL